MQYSYTHLNKVFTSTAVTSKLIPVPAMRKMGIKTAADAKKFFYGKTPTQASDMLKAHGIDAKFRSIITNHLDGGGSVAGPSSLIAKYATPSGKEKLDDMLTRSAKDKRVYLFLRKKLPQVEQDEFRKLVILKKKNMERILKSGMHDAARKMQNDIAMGIAPDDGVQQHDLAGLTAQGGAVGNQPTAGINSDAGKQSNASSVKTENMASISAAMSKKPKNGDPKKKYHKPSALTHLSI